MTFYDMNSLATLLGEQIRDDETEQQQHNSNAGRSQYSRGLPWSYGIINIG
jgi:hypothetical protein